MGSVLVWVRAAALDRLLAACIDPRSARRFETDWIVVRESGFDQTLLVSSFPQRKLFDNQVAVEVASRERPGFRRREPSEVCVS